MVVRIEVLDAESNLGIDEVRAAAARASLAALGFPPTVVAVSSYRGGVGVDIAVSVVVDVTISVGVGLLDA